MLRDKEVPKFKSLRLGNLDDGFRRGHRHYGSQARVENGRAKSRSAVEADGGRAAQGGGAGLMPVAPLVPGPEQGGPVFARLRELAQAHGLAGLSMGMTDDYAVAIEEGATVVRVGRAIFGERRS